MKLDTYHKILQKLNGFCRKYYTRMLFRGLIVFLALGAVIFFGLLAVEYYLWLGSSGRFVLLCTGLLAEGFLLVRYIIRPLIYLFNIRKGIGHKQASILIGRHFTEVDDKLYNLLDLAEDSERSELLLASIEQRSERLVPVPFGKAIDYRETRENAKYLLFPLALILLLWFSGHINDFLSSYARVVHYDLAYQPPAPFVLNPLVGDLEVLENKPFTVQVSTSGTVTPDRIFINLNGREYLMEEENGMWTYTFKPPLQSITFYFTANEIRSQSYDLIALKVPAIEDFSMQLNFPAYVNRKPEVIKSTGNATFPEGTNVIWRIKGKNTRDVKLQTKDTAYYFTEMGREFEFGKKVYRSMDYRINTTNNNVENFEVLQYQFNVTQDAYPKIHVKEVRDSLDHQVRYYIGEVSDDYGLRSISLFWYPEGDNKTVKEVQLAAPNSSYESFYYTFPSGLPLTPGVNYEYYFGVTDNDGIHGGKQTRSQVFNTRILTREELKDQQLESQHDLLKGIDKTFNQFKEDKNILKSINQTQKEKEVLNYNDQNQIRDFLLRQKNQEELMQKFTRSLQENIKGGDMESQDDKLLQERLQRREDQARKNAALLEELRKVADKIDKEDLTKRLDELSKQRQSEQRDLEQLLELTKRYYVSEMASELAKEFEKRGIEQQKMTKESEEFSSLEKKQAEANGKYEDISDKLDTLQKDNRELHEPLRFNVDKEEQESIKKEQEDALKMIKEGKEMKEWSMQKAKKVEAKQKSAGQKMLNISKTLKMAVSKAGGESGMAEDAAMLRQILDNLVIFSFKQEKLFGQLERSGGELANYSGEVKEQQELRELFSHVDDSLFALSLRRPEISELVNKQITEVYYNVDKALESISDDRIYQGVSYQQYVFTAANTLAEFLADVLDNLQLNLSMGAGKGNGQMGFQLPDIIKSQEEIRERLNGMGSKGEQSSEGEKGNSNATQGSGNSNGEKNGSSGEKGKGGNSENGEKNGGDYGRNGDVGISDMSEEELKELYEIYKEQQELREALERQLKDLIDSGDRKLAERILKQMEDFRDELLENGITQSGRDRINQIQYELLKLENASLKQGEKELRESITNKRNYSNPITTRPSLMEKDTNEIEVLSRQALPLHDIFKKKVKEYFQEDD